jgi:sugar phosphate isomerase/epimerase
MFRRLKEIGYDGMVLPEPFRKYPEEKSFEETLRLAAKYVEQVWPKD